MRQFSGTHSIAGREEKNRWEKAEMKSLRSFCYMQLKNRGGSIWIVALLILLSSWGAQGTFAQSSAKAARPSNKQLASPEIERKVDALLKKMTLEEKLGQLVQYSDSGYSG